MANGIWFLLPILPFTIFQLLPAWFAIPSAATASITAAAAATTASVTAIAATPATTTTAIATILARSGLIDGQVTAVQISPVELLNCFLAVLLGCHLDEAKST